MHFQMLYHQLSEGGSVLFSKLAALTPNEKVKCLSAVGMRKRQAGGRKESQQWEEALAEVNLHCPGELKTVLFIRGKNDICCAVLRASSPSALNCLCLFGAK